MDWKGLHRPRWLRVLMAIAVIAATLGMLPVLASAAPQARPAVVVGPGNVWAWGNNLHGELGDGTTTERHSPVMVVGLSGVIAVTGGGTWGTSLAAKSDGSVWAWGDNDHGQLGDGTTTGRYSPVQVAGVSGVTAVAEGRQGHSLALKSDGSVWAWGNNLHGQLGDGTTTDRYSPVQVVGLSGAKAISAGGAHSLALKSDGSVWAWGDNSGSAVGPGNTNDRPTPAQVPAVSGITAIVAGGAHSLVVKSDGSVWGWGLSDYGQLGDGFTSQRGDPVQALGLSGVTAVAAGGAHSLALKSDGSVWAWGNNWYGQLGDGTITNRHSPIQVPGLTGVTIVGGGAQSLALKSDGSVWAWGINGFGQLGDGTTIERHSPVQVPGLSGITGLGAADGFSFAITAPPPPPPPPAAYTAVTPVRLMDTRIAGGPLGPGGFRSLTVAGVTPGAPAGVTAVALNVTATNTTAASYLTVYPAGATQPLASNLNWVAGNTVPSLVIVQVGTGGAITMFNAFGSADVVVDLEGYFAAPSGTAGGEVGLTPARITDTRTASGFANAGNPLVAGATFSVQVTGAGGVPTTGVSAAILNVTVTNTTAASFLTIWPAGATRPTASNLNWTSGVTVPNRVIVPVSAMGKVSVFNQFGSADAIVDVSGYFTDATASGKLFTPISPIRLLDTRSSAQTLGPGGAGDLPVGGVAGVPSGASAAVLNVTVTNTSAPGFLTVFPSTAVQPTASDLNWVAGMTIPNLVVATLGTTGLITIYNSAGSTDVVVDLAGWFA